MQPKRVSTNGRPMRGTAREKKKMQEYKIHDKIEKRLVVQTCSLDIIQCTLRGVAKCFVTIFFLAVLAVQCDPKCKGAQGICQSNGRCFCWWGWTGPNAAYIMSGKNKNRILVLMTNYF